MCTYGLCELTTRIDEPEYHPPCLHHATTRETEKNTDADFDIYQFFNTDFNVDNQQYIFT